MEQKILYKLNASTKGFANEFELFLKNSLGVDNINMLHEQLSETKRLEYLNDQNTFIHRLVYKDFDKDIQSKLVISYRNLAEILCRKSGIENKINDWAIQRFPSVRVQFPNNVSVFEFHRDSDYQHPIGEINNFLAVTPCINTAALFVEKTLGWSNYFPLNLKKGELAQLNTSIFKHGDKVNQEGYTRISIDFRMIPIKAINEDKVGESITCKKKFDTTSYYYSFST